MTVLVLALRRRLLAAPGLERTHPHRRRQSRSYEQDLLVQGPVDPDENTEQGSHKGNRQDRGHIVTQRRQDLALFATFAQPRAEWVCSDAKERKIKEKFTVFSRAVCEPRPARCCSLSTRCDPVESGAVGAVADRAGRARKGRRKNARLTTGYGAPIQGPSVSGPSDFEAGSRRRCARESPARSTPQTSTPGSSRRAPLRRT
jgi:hypothetical protein